MDKSGQNIVGEETRCKCNKLLLTVKNDIILIKCSRCKRYMLIRTQGISSFEVYDLDSSEIKNLIESET